MGVGLVASPAPKIFRAESNAWDPSTPIKGRKKSIFFYRGGFVRMRARNMGNLWCLFFKKVVVASVEGEVIL